MHILFIISLFFLTAAFTPAQALTITNPTESEHASYRVTYGGATLGKVRIWWEADAQYYKITAMIKTSGMLRLFNKQTRHVELTGIREHGEYRPIHYHATVEYPHKQRSTTMRYEDGRLREIILNPPHDPDMPLEQISSAVDPMSALLHLLRFMREPIHANELYAARIFDGKRLLHGVAFPHKEPSDACLLPCRTYVLHRKALAGFNAEKTEALREGGEPIYLRHDIDSSYFPLELETSIGIGTVRAVRE